MYKPYKILYFKTDFNGIIGHYNENFAQTFGLKDETSSKIDFFKFVHYEDLHLIIKSLNRLKLNKSIHEIVEIRKKNDIIDFSYYYWEITTEKTPDNQSIFTFLGYDITNSKNNEFEEIDSKYILNKSQELAGMATFRYDIITKKLDWSAESIHIYNAKSIDDLTLPFVLSKVHPEDLHLCDYTLIEKILSTKSTFIINTRLVDKSFEGGIKYIEGIYEYYYNSYSDKEFVIGAIVDITKLKKKENELSEIINHLNSILEDNDIAISVINKNYKIVSFNQEFSKIMSFLEFNLSTGQSLLELIPLQHIEMVKTDLDKIFEGLHLNKIAPIDYQNGYLLNNIHYYPIKNKTNDVEFVVINCKFNSKYTYSEKFQNDNVSIAKSIIKYQENEKDRIATDLHDSVNQLLYIAKIHLSNVPEHQSKEKATQLIDKASEEIKSIMNNSSKFLLDNTSLSDAIQEYLDITLGSSKINYKLEISNKKNISLSEETKLVIFRITQEIIQNVFKHANATNFIIKKKYYDDSFTIIFADNGNGFNVTNKPKGCGLENIKNRTTLLKGKLKIISKYNKGTIFIILIPL